MPSEAETESHVEWRTAPTLLLIGVVLTLPCLVFPYLPMTDLPQHVAIVSIMRHLYDPAYGFSAHYTWALDRTLYVFPYLLALGFSYFLPVKLAVQVVVFWSVVSYPLGIVMFLHAARRPLWLGLLALPIAYHRGFFWGFVHFSMGVGLAFMTLSLLVGSWSR